MIRSVFWFIISAVLIAGPGHASEATLERVHPQALRQLIEEGLENNEGLRARARQVDALGRRAVSAGALDDPRIGINLINLPTDTWNLDQEAMTQKQISVSQRIPWKGKRALREQFATIDMLEKQIELTAARLSVYGDIAENYYELGFVAESQSINKRLMSLMDQILRAAESRYATGKGMQQDILRVQVEQSRLMDEAIVLGKKRRQVQDLLLQALNRKGFSEIAPPSLDRMTDLVIDTDQWAALALANNPGIRTGKLKVDQARIDIELARKAYWPDPDLRLSYGQRDDDAMGRNRSDFISAGVTFSIPLWARDKQDQRLAGAESRLAAAQARLRKFSDALPHRIDSLATEIRHTRESYRLFDEAVLIQVRQWAASLLSAYGAGRVDFASVIEAHRRLLRFELQKTRYLYNVFKKIAALEKLLGLEPGASAPSGFGNPPGAALGAGNVSVAKEIRK